MSIEQQLDWLTTSVGVFDLPDRALIEVSGDDAAEWLQGQLSNQCEGRGAGDSVYGFILTLKGRVLVDAWALFEADRIWLDVPADRVDAVLERLDRYIIMEDVDLAAQPELGLATALGPRADELADGGWPADRFGTGGRVWVVPKGDREPTLAQLAASAEARGGGTLDEEGWAAAHVVHGRPRFGLDFGDWTYPQETGLTPVAVSFKKGCYVGQETVVMLQNRGKAPKVLWRWKSGHNELPPAKTPIVREGAEVGEVTSATSYANGLLALGFLKRGHEAEGQGFEVLGRPIEAIQSVSDGVQVDST